MTVHELRDKEAVENLQEKSIPERVQDSWNKTRNAVSSRTRNFFSHPENIQCNHIPPKYSYVFRPKSRWELIRLGGTVCGIEICVSAELAFVTPIILGLGLGIKFVSIIWCLSPLIGFFLTPILGSMSDSCESRYGRRRPFILLLSIGILLGLLFVAYGHQIGIALGDKPYIQDTSKNLQLINGTDSLNSCRKQKNLVSEEDFTEINSTKTITQKDFQSSVESNSKVPDIDAQSNFQNKEKCIAGGSSHDITYNKTEIHVQPWSIVFTVMGTVLLDFCADACLSPSRTYLLDVSLPEDHPVGLSTLSLMTGLGGSIGYLIGAVHWEYTYLGHLLGGQIQVVFMTVIVIFIICMISTLCSHPEIPLNILKEPKVLKEYQEKMKISDFQEREEEMVNISKQRIKYGTYENSGFREDIQSSSLKATYEIPDVKITELTVTEERKCDSINYKEPISSILEGDQPTLKEYLRSIIHMPKSLRILCLTNLFCCMSLSCYSLYFTDFVGDVVYGGNPQAAKGSEDYKLYQNGVSFGCWGMALNCISCSCYSYFMESLVKKFGAKSVYIGGQLVYSTGMVIMAVARHKMAVILFSATAGIMLSTIFTMPYLLIAHYHCKQKFQDDKHRGESGVRGVGTDVAIVSSMVFLSQFILSLSMSTIIHIVGSHVVTVCTAAFLSACGAISATQVMYLDM